ncbi:MAG TPA: (2Fe-2S)-binding protein, partial [Thermoanaerobaculia bacterium]
MIPSPETESQNQQASTPARNREQEPNHVIICICRGKSDRDIAQAIENGATSLRDLQRCGIGDQCGSCNNTLRGMLARAAEERA